MHRGLAGFVFLLTAFACDDSQEADQRCQGAQAAVAEALDALDDSCESDADCALDFVDVGECSEPFAASAGELRGAAELPALFRAKRRACPPSEVSCEPPAGEAACREGRCVVVDP